MTLMIPKQLEQLNSLGKRTIATARDIDNLEPGAMLALTAGFIAAAIILSSLFWVPTAMAIGATAYRFWNISKGRDRKFTEATFTKFDGINRRLQQIWRSELPENHKKFLTERLLALLSIDAGEIEGVYGYGYGLGSNLEAAERRAYDELDKAKKLASPEEMLRLGD